MTRSAGADLDSFNLVEDCRKSWYQCPSTRRSAGAAERDGLENRCGGDPTQGSNPCFSAS